MKTLAALFAGFFLFATASADDKLFTFEFEEIADGVWVGVRPDSPRFPVMGNSTFVISDKGVVVFDGGGTPLMTEQIIDKVRSLTTNPVTHVVISHWHGDHNFGIYRFTEEFPDVQVIAHQFTAKVIDSTRIAYIDRGPTYIGRNEAAFREMVETGKDSEGNPILDEDRKIYARILDDAEIITGEAERARVTPPSVTFEDEVTINSGERVIKLLHLGHANTAGDIVMWLPKERIVATGDIVVLPSPYAFNMPPRAWAQTMRNIVDLKYRVMVPGHGSIQRDNDYINLLIEAADSIADQRDAMLAEGMEKEAVETGLDFSAFEQRFTGDDAYIKLHYDAWFENPFREAAMKALTGEPMVAIDEPEQISFDDERWQIEALESERVSYLGQNALKLLGGSAVLEDLDIINGKVEFDIAVNGDRGFAGLMFRVQDSNNHEHFYIRPHQSGKPDANQYTPVFNGVSAWQLYHGTDYSAPTAYRNNEWMHVKIIYAGSRADIYIDSDEPILRVNNLKREVGSGSIGIDAASFSPAWFANLQITKLANAYYLPARHEAEKPAQGGQVTSWSISEPFDQDVLQGVTSISDELRDSQLWTRVNAEQGGITNLASVPMRSVGKNTRFARLTIHSDRRQTRQLSFGYSDIAKVFVNGELRYAGDNTYQSRDYRYLGTIGLFDTVVLPLSAGDNEVLIAVTEAFGGWGIMGQLDNLEGITFK